MENNSNSNSKPRLLVVEDEKALGIALKEKFEREGFDVFIEVNGGKALTRALELKPNVILLDVLLPGMDGLTLLKRLRQDPWGNTVPVIILSNVSDDEKLKESVQLHAANYMVKSNWTINDIVEQVRQCLK